MKISKRLVTICSLVKPGLGVADVGADHGLVEKYLLDNNISPYVVAIENKKGPYTILKNALEGYENVRISLSDGIEDIDEKVAILVLAGIGGINIVNILMKDVKKLAKVQQIVVDAHRDLALVKDTIHELGFDIEKEVEIIEANKKYNIVSFVKRRK